MTDNNKFNDLWCDDNDSDLDEIQVITGLECLDNDCSRISSIKNTKEMPSTSQQSPCDLWTKFDSHQKKDNINLAYASKRVSDEHYSSNNRTEQFRLDYSNKNWAVIDETEQLIERLKAAEEIDLINLNDDVNTLIRIDKKVDDNSEAPSSQSSILQTTVVEGRTIQNEEKVNSNLLPRCAIVYDYTTQPVTAKEQKRHFLPHFGTPSSPLLRPIVIDGVGLVKAFRNCCCTNIIYYPFPIIPIMRCLFYWISKGHSTILCFPSIFNPIDDELFNASSSEKLIMQKLRDFKMCTIFETKSEEDNKKWYSEVLEAYRSCLITTVSQWRLSMPNNLMSGVMTNGAYGFTNYMFNCNPRNSYYGEKCPERLLQPFFSHEGKTVFFSSFSSQGACVADMILDTTVMSLEEFKYFNANQLSFIEQARMLKVLYSYLPETSRFRETAVMVKILERLKPFLP